MKYFDLGMRCALQATRLQVVLALLMGTGCGSTTAIGETKAGPSVDDATAGSASEASEESDAVAAPVDVGSIEADDASNGHEEERAPTDGSDPSVHYFDLNDADAWSELDLGLVAARDEFNTKRYDGAAFDGRYVYFAQEPYQIDEALLRYDTDAPFDAPDSWQRFNVKALGGGDGCRGAIFAAGFVYLAPHHHDVTSSNTLIVRFAPEWFGTKIEVFDVGILGAPGDYRGEYAGIVFDGRFLTFVPGGLEPHPKFTRYDTTLPFGSVASWSTSMGVSLGIGPQIGGFSDGSRVYTFPGILPIDDLPPGVPTIAVAIDPGKSLADGGAFQMHDVGSISSGAVYDGRYGYLLPTAGTSVLRYDTRQGFGGNAGWIEYPIGRPAPPLPSATRPGSFDGRFVYFFGPSELVRLDTQGDPAQPSSWDARELTRNSLYMWSLRGQVFDGEYLYVGGDSAMIHRFHVRTPKLVKPPNGGSFF